MYSFNLNDIHVSNICFNDAYLHTISTVISTWSRLCEIYTYICFLHESEGCHGVGCVVAVGIAGCHNDNLRCPQWRHSWHCGSSRFSVLMHLFKCFYVSNQMVCEIPLHSVPSLFPYFVTCFLQTTQKRHPMAHSLIRAVALFRLLLFDIEVTDCDIYTYIYIYILRTRSTLHRNKGTNRNKYTQKKGKKCKHITM